MRNVVQRGWRVSETPSEAFPEEMVAETHPKFHARLRSLEKESAPEIKAQGILNVGLQLETEGNLSGAARLYQWLQSQDASGNADVTASQEEAVRRIAALSGKGEFGKRLEFILPAFLRMMSDPETAVLMIGTNQLLRFSRLAIAPRLQRISGNLFRRPLLFQKSWRPALLGPAMELNAVKQPLIQVTSMMSSLGNRGYGGGIHGAIGGVTRGGLTYLKSPRAKQIIPLLMGLSNSFFLHHCLYYGGNWQVQRKESPEEKEARQIKQQLIEEAKAVLSGEGQKVRKANFFAFSESVGGVKRRSLSQTDQHLLNWGVKVVGYRFRFGTEADPEKKIRRIASGLYFDFYNHYARDYSEFCDFLEEGKGNCVAQTKLFFATLEQMEVDLPEGEGFAVQVFKNHVQPVHYKLDAQGEVVEVRSLVTGKKLPHLVADIYHSDIFYVGFLRKHRIKPPKSFDELRIAKAKPEYLQRGPLPPDFPPGIDVEFPESEAVFNGDAPDDAILPPPDFDAQESDTKKNPPPDGDYLIKLFSENPKLKDYPIDYIFLDEGMFFRTLEEKERFQSLSLEQFPDFQVSLLKISMNRFEKNSDLKNMLPILSKPYERIGKLNNNELDKVAQFYYFQDALLASVAAINYELSPDWKDLSQEKRWAKILEGLLTWQLLYKKKLASLETLANDPKVFFPAFNDWVQSQENGRLANLLGKDLGLLPPAEAENILKKMVDQLADPKKIGIHADPKLQTSYVAPPDELIWFDLDINDSDTNPPGEEPSEPTPKPSPEPTSPEAAITISPEAMMHLILAVGGMDGALLERWDSSVAQAYRKSSEDGRQLAPIFEAWYAAKVRKEYPNASDEEIRKRLEKALQDPKAHFPPPLVDSLEVLTKQLQAQPTPAP